MAEPDASPANQQVFLIDVDVGDIGDRLFVADIGPITSDGAVIAHNGRAIGAIDPAENGEDGTRLKITLGADAEAWEAVAAALRFATIADEPMPAALTATVVPPAADGTFEAAPVTDVQVPVLALEEPLGHTAADDILAEGLGVGRAAGAAHAGAILYVSEDHRASLETGEYNQVISGFTLGAGGDVLDLGSVLRLGTYDGGSLQGYVELDDSSGTHTVVRVDIYGTGNFTDLAIIEGATGLGDADGLLHNGNVVV
jgi:hypothetical protein